MMDFWLDGYIWLATALSTFESNQLGRTRREEYPTVIAFPQLRW
jgi:hypothetical protein